MDHYRLVCLTILLQLKFSPTGGFAPMPSKDHVLRVSSPRIPVYESDQSVKVLLDRLDGSADAMKVQYFTVSFTAREGLDFRSTNGTILFEDGLTEATVEVPLVNDDVLEPVERFFLLFETEKVNVFTVLSIHDDDIYSEWSDWSDVPKCCTAACRLTECVQTRTRTCKATYKSMCSKQLKEARYRPCFSEECDVDDGCWSDWSQWTSDTECRSFCRVTRMRECSCDECSGPAKETKREGCQNL